MKGILAAAAIGAACAVAAAAVAGGRSSAAGEQLYYGRTTQGRAISIDLQGGRTAGGAGAWTLRDRYFLMLANDMQRPLPGGTAFVRNALHAHRVVHEVNDLRAEVWFDARRSADAATVSGTYREVIAIGGGKPTGSGTIRFKTTLWAASNGAPWTGRTADGQPLAAAVKLLPSPQDQPRYAITVPSLELALRCTGADGSTIVTRARVRSLTAPLVAVRHWPPPAHGEYMFAHGLATLGATARATATTPEGIAARVALGVSHLRWQGAGLVAAGTITVSGSGAGATCPQSGRGFTLRPGAGV